MKAKMEKKVAFIGLRMVEFGMFQNVKKESFSAVSDNFLTMI